MCKRVSAVRCVGISREGSKKRGCFFKLPRCGWEWDYPFGGNGSFPYVLSDWIFPSCPWMNTCASPVFFAISTVLSIASCLLFPTVDARSLPSFFPCQVPSSRWVTWYLLFAILYGFLSYAATASTTKPFQDVMTHCLLHGDIKRMEAIDGGEPLVWEQRANKNA